MFEQYDKTKRYLIACSGGPDSMALLAMLLKENFSLLVAHVNYKTRDESDEEEQLVRNYCLQNHIEVQVAVYQDDQSKDSFEVKARRFRYRFFNQLYVQYHCHGLFVAHHKDDLIETYLLKKERKVINDSYLILPQVKMMNMMVYRPLLQQFMKEDLFNYCMINHIPFGIDKTNEMDIYPRNKIRKQLRLVDKEKIYNQALIDEQHLIQKREEVRNYIARQKRFATEELKSKDDFFLSLFLYEAIAEPYKRKVTKALTLRLKEFLKSDKPNLKFQIEKDYYLLKEYDEIVFSHLYDESFCYVFEKLQFLSTPHFSLKENGEKMEGIYVSSVDFPITIRSYQREDYIQLKNGKKKVSRLMIDKKIPKERRKMIPVIENCHHEIIFVHQLYRKYGYKNVKNNLFVIQ